MSVCTLICRTCGGTYDLSSGENHKPCPACGTENCRPQAEADVGDIFRRATSQRLRCDFKHAEASYQFILNTSPDEHEALWGLVQCRYAVEYVKDPRTGKPQPIVHAVRTRPMLTDPDFREACNLAPEAVREQYRQEAEYIDNAMVRIRELGEKGDAYDVFLCHKTSRTDGVEGYTEDYNRAVQLYIMLREMGYKVFFAPFAGLTPGDNYEAGIYHAISTAKVMLVICSNQDYINSPWVRTEWQRFLEMSYEPGADKHLIPLLYEGLPPRRLPDDFRQLQAITMGELNAKDLLVAAVKRHVGEKAAAPAPTPAPQPVQPAPAPAPNPVGEGLAPSRPAPAPAPAKYAVNSPDYSPESYFTTKAVSGGLSITGYLGDRGDVRIPPTIGGEQVVEIGTVAFKDRKDLTTVTIPRSVKRIESSAFSGCSELTSVTIPPSVTTIWYSAFSGCKSLKSVDIPSSVTRIHDGAFRYCASLTEVDIPNSVKRIGDGAFSDCSSLTSVHLHSDVQEIGRNPFSNCRFLKTITLAYVVKSKKYYVLDNVLMSHDNELVCYPAGLTASSYTVPAGVTTIGPDAFSGCGNLTSVSIPDSVTSIGVEAFYSCQRLTHVNIPEGVTTIESGTFQNCSSLPNLIIPASVTSVGFFAFERCPNLTLHVHPNTPAHTYARKNNVRFTLIGSASQPVQPAPAPAPVGEGLAPSRPAPQPTSAYAPESHFKTESVDGGVAITGYTGPGGEVLIPPTIGGKRVVKIGNHSFDTRMTVKKIVIPSGVTGIGVEAFNCCSNLTSVSIPDSVTSIGTWAFFGCSSLKSVSIPVNVTALGSNPFLWCKALTSVSVAAGNSRYYVREGVLMSLDNKVVCYPAGLPASNYTIPSGVTGIADGAFSGCCNLTSVNIPEGVTYIGVWAFGGCSSLTSINIPESVTHIGGQAFDDCSSLRSMSIPQGVRRIGEGAFKGCSNLTLHVQKGSTAHAYAQQNRLRHEVPSLLSRLFGKK